MVKTNKKYQLPLLDEYLENIQSNNYSTETVYNYERDLNTFENFLESDIKTEFKKLTKRSIIKFKAYLSSTSRTTASNEVGEKKLSSYSINRILSALRSYLKFLIDVDYKTPVTADAVKLLKTEKKYGQVPEMNQLITLIEAPSKFETDPTIKLRNRAMLETLFATGMRISELLSLKREQLDNTGRIYVMGKGKKQRFVYLTPRAIKHIKDYLATRHDSTPYIFIPYRGLNNADKNKKISTNYLQSKIKRYRELLAINIPISAHSIRHSFATYLAENGANPAAIQILLGHESLDTTTRYVHASDRYAEKMHTDFHPLKK
ncbi:MAG: tyrosine-type recombinase/integrase [Candidatus Komeilibacteria bacterium]|jgi:integrase/recombinase XerD|nr:tyrosine-type recombinase/integrase [Candidatus Komeilibacteria bacterium]MBT4447652.1 tyrosine-type recombinase/integrase [Candidatus Komeilibacteria bacterium]